MHGICPAMYTSCVDVLNPGHTPLVKDRADASAREGSVAKSLAHTCGPTLLGNYYGGSLNITINDKPCSYKETQGDLLVRGKYSVLIMYSIPEEFCV